MNNSFISTAQCLPLLLLAFGTLRMAKAILRENHLLFRDALYIHIAASAGIIFLYCLQYVTHPPLLVPDWAYPAFIISVVMVFVSLLGVSYHYIHGSMPEAVIKLSLTLALAALFTNTALALPNNILKKTTQKHRFVEASEYQNGQGKQG